MVMPKNGAGSTFIPYRNRLEPTPTQQQNGSLIDEYREDNDVVSFKELEIPNYVQSDSFQNLWAESAERKITRKISIWEKIVDFLSKSKKETIKEINTIEGPQGKKETVTGKLVALYSDIKASDGSFTPEEFIELVLFALKDDDEKIDPKKFEAQLKPALDHADMVLKSRERELRRTGRDENEELQEQKIQRVESLEVESSISDTTESDKEINQLLSDLENPHVERSMSKTKSFESRLKREIVKQEILSENPFDSEESRKELDMISDDSSVSKTVENDESEGFSLLDTIEIDGESDVGGDLSGFPETSGGVIPDESDHDDIYDKPKGNQIGSLLTAPEGEHDDLYDKPKETDRGGQQLYTVEIGDGKQVTIQVDTDEIMHKAKYSELI